MITIGSRVTPASVATPTPRRPPGVPGTPVARTARRAASLSCRCTPPTGRTWTRARWRRAPRTRRCAGTGWLSGWRLTFGGEDLGWEGALATVVEDPLVQVFVVLYDVPDDDAAQLDRWEGAELGLYTKIRVRVHTLDGDVLAWIYVLDAYEGGLPSARYLGMLADAAEQAGAPATTSPTCAAARASSPPDPLEPPLHVRGCAAVRESSVRARRVQRSRMASRAITYSESSASGPEPVRRSAP